MKITKKFEEDGLTVDVKTIKLKQVKSIMQIVVRAMNIKNAADASEQLENLDFNKIFENVDTVIAIADESVIVRKSDSDAIVSVEELDMEQIMELFPVILEVNQCFLQPLMGELAHLIPAANK